MIKKEGLTLNHFLDYKWNCWPSSATLYTKKNWIKNLILFSVSGIISAMAKYEETKTCKAFFEILDKVDNMEKVK